MSKKKRLGEVLVDAGLINDNQLSAALQSQRTWGGKFGSTLVRMGFAKEEDILRALSSQLLLPAVDFNKVKIMPKALSALPLRIAEKYNVIPVAIREEQNHKQLVLVMSDPTNLEAISEIEFQTGCRVRPAVATDSSITRAIDFYYRKNGIAMAENAAPVGVAKVDESDKMRLVSDDRASSSTEETLDQLSPGMLLKLLMRVLIKKNIISKQDLVAELRRKKS